MASRNNRGRPIRLSWLVRQGADIPPDRGGAFRRERNLLSENRNDPEALRLKRAVADELAAIAAQGVRFNRGRQKGAVSDKALHIRELVARYPTLQAKALRKKADEAKLGGMDDRTFANQVSAARKSRD